MEVLLGLAFAGLLGALVIILREGKKRDEVLILAVQHAITENTRQRELQDQAILELTSKIQHPEIAYPPIRAVPDPEPTEPDPELMKAGQIFPEDNGQPEDAGA